MATKAKRKFEADERKMRKFADEGEDKMSSKPRAKKKHHKIKVGHHAAAGKRVKHMAGKKSKMYVKKG
jgi:hypothetical protein